jgi:hypothetical protein
MVWQELKIRINNVKLIVFLYIFYIYFFLSKLMAISVTRQKGRFAGFSLYVSNTTRKEDGYLCYKNGQELPPLDFDTTCVKHGRYVIFYNERLDGSTYPTGYVTASVFTELCEVTVTGNIVLHITVRSCSECNE